MKDNTQVVNLKIGKQRVQYHDIMKLGYMMCLTTKIKLSYQIEFFQEHVEEILESRVLITLSVAKINNGIGFKDNSSNQLSSYQPKKKKVEYWRIHIETVKSQEVKVK